MNCPHCGKDTSKTVKRGDRFYDKNTLMEVAYIHETMAGNWWCKSVKESSGLWAYSAEYILKRLCEKVTG
jgi:hypothetical protein